MQLLAKLWFSSRAVRAIVVGLMLNIYLGVILSEASLSDSFLLTCGGIESVAWHLKTVRRRSFGRNKTGPR